MVACLCKSLRRRMCDHPSVGVRVCFVKHAALRGGPYGSGRGIYSGNLAAPTSGKHCCRHRRFWSNAGRGGCFPRAVRPSTEERHRPRQCVGGLRAAKSCRHVAQGSRAHCNPAPQPPGAALRSWDLVMSLPRPISLVGPDDGGRRADAPVVSACRRFRPPEQARAAEWLMVKAATDVPATEVLIRRRIGLRHSPSGWRSSGSFTEAAGSLCPAQVSVAPLPG
jgi:hypothetical protein